jgi:hypothetical protein
MKKKILILVMILSVSFVWLPSFGDDVSAQRGNVSKHRKWPNWDQQRGHGKHKGWRNKKNTFGYRNYGQYRRTQVGNRRFRTVKRYYWQDGIRLSRLVRVYY